MPQAAADRSNQPDTPAPPRATADERTAHETLALDLASTPTAAGREHRVIQRIRDWARPLAGVRINADDAGNLIVERENAAPPSERAPLFITAHMDHPAFTLEERSQAGDLLLSFRGGVLDPYFTNAQLVMFTDDHAPVRARIISTQGPDNDPAYPAHAKFLRTCIARIDP